MSDTGGTAPGPPAAVTEPWLRTGRLIELLAPAPGARILLAGDAEGLLASRLARDEAARVTWLEPGPGDRRQSATRVDKDGGSGWVTFVGDLCSTPFEAEEFDAVASQFTVEYLEDPAAALSEWLRVMKPGGRLALVTRNALYGGGDPRPRPRPRRSYSPEQLRQVVRGAGFEVNGVGTLLPDLRFPRLYRGDLSFSYRFERLPYFRERGLLLFLSAAKTPGRDTVGDQGGP
jgi:SAM-dependent methyltransferase